MGAGWPPGGPPPPGPPPPPGAPGPPCPPDPPDPLGGPLLLIAAFNDAWIACAVVMNAVLIVASEPLGSSPVLVCVIVWVAMGHTNGGRDCMMVMGLFLISWSSASCTLSSSDSLLDLLESLTCLCFPRRISDGLSNRINSCTCCSSSMLDTVPGANGVYCGGGNSVSDCLVSSGVS